MILLQSGADWIRILGAGSSKKLIFVFIAMKEVIKKTYEYYLLPYSSFFYHFHPKKYTVKLDH